MLKLSYVNLKVWESNGSSLVGRVQGRLKQLLSVYSQFQDHFAIVEIDGQSTVKLYNLKSVFPVLKYFPISYWHLKFCHYRLILYKSLVEVFSCRG